MPHQSAAEALRDSLLSHQVGLNRLSNAEVRAILKILRRAERAVLAELIHRIFLLKLRDQDAGPFVTKWTRDTLDAIEAILAEAYEAMGLDLSDRLREIAEYETEFGLRLLRGSVPRDARGHVVFHRPSAEILKAIVSSRPFQGALLREYFKRNGKKSLVAGQMRLYRKAIREAIEDAVVRSLTVETAIRKLRLKTLGIPRRHLAAVVDTSIKHVTQSARQEFLKANSGDDGVVKGYQWLATLDLRTTLEYCVPRDGKEYDLDFQPVGHGYSWGAGPGRIHWRCRSTMTAVLKSWEELGIDAKELSGRTRASMDGQTAEWITAEDWLKGQSQERLEQMFGEERARLFLSGEVSVDDLIKRDGELWTLEELREREG